MLTLILGVVIGAAVIVALGCKLFTPSKKRPKPYASKSPSSKLLSTLKARLTKSINDLNKGLRTPEIIEAEITNELNRFYNCKAEEFKSIASDLTNAIGDCDNLIEQMEKNKRQIQLNMRKVKESMLEGTRSKEDSVSLIGNSMAVMQSIEKNISETQNKKKELQSKKDKIMDQCDLFIQNFQIKRVDIMNKIITMKASALDLHSGLTSTNIDGFVDEFMRSISIETDNVVIEKKFYGSDEDLSQPVVANDTPELREKALKYLEVA